MADRLASTLFADADQWDDHAPDHAAILTEIGGASARTAPQVAVSVLNLAQRSPVAVAFKITGDVEHIYVAHSLSLFPQDLLDHTAFDFQTVALLGNNFDTATPVVLSPDASGRINDTRCQTAAQLVLGHAAAPPVYTSGPHAATAPETSVIRVRRAFVLAPGSASTVLAASPTGRFTLQGFYARFLQPDLDSGDAALVAAITPLRDWWRAACTLTAAGGSVIDVDPITSALPLVNQRMTAWVTRQKTSALARLGVGGPGLTTAAFAAGVESLSRTMNTNATERLNYERARSQQSFTEKHGGALAQKMYYLTSQIRDNDLPEIHRLLAKSPRGRESGILANALEDRTQASPVPLALSNVPLVTTKILEEVFRGFTVSGSGLTFAAGLTPFAIVCSGHAEGAAIQSKLRQAAMAESGTSLTLEDAAKLTATDVRFPTTPQVAAEKLFGWSIYIDIFHGHATDIATNIRDMVTEVAPSLHTIHTHYGGTDSTRSSMDVVNRVLYDIQQDYFKWATAVGHGRVVVAPTFTRVRDLVSTFRAESLSPLPAFWYTLMDPPPRPPRNPRGSTPGPATPRDLSGATSTHNPHADSRLVQRFRDSEFTSISAMMQGHQCTVPKHGSEEVCLSWALKGRCNSQCQRHSQHQRYSRDTIRGIHTLLDDCGVANPQE